MDNPYEVEFSEEFLEKIKNSRYGTRKQKILREVTFLWIIEVLKKKEDHRILNRSIDCKIALCEFLLRIYEEDYELSLFLQEKEKLLTLPFGEELNELYKSWLKPSNRLINLCCKKLEKQKYLLRKSCDGFLINGLYVRMMFCYELNSNYFTSDINVKELKLSRKI